MNKKQMYNRIMESVAKEVKKALNEEHYRYNPVTREYEPVTYVDLEKLENSNIVLGEEITEKLSEFSMDFYGSAYESDEIEITCGGKTFIFTVELSDDFDSSIPYDITDTVEFTIKNDESYLENVTLYIPIEDIINSETQTEFENVLEHALLSEVEELVDSMISHGEWYE